MFIISYWKEILIGILGLSCYIMSVSKNRANEKIEELTRQIVNIQQEAEIRVQRISERNREVVIVETRTDGTVITTTEKEKEKIKVSEESTVNTNVHSDTTVSKRTDVSEAERYSAGVYYNPWTNRYNVDIGSRLGFLPLEAVIQSNDNFSNVAVGVRLRW